MMMPEIIIAGATSAKPGMPKQGIPRFPIIRSKQGFEVYACHLTVNGIEEGFLRKKSSSTCQHFLTRVLCIISSRERWLTKTSYLARSTSPCQMEGRRL